MLFLTINFAFVSVSAAPGELDATFGTNGSVVTSVSPFTNVVNADAIQPDGKILAVGGGSSEAAVYRGRIWYLQQSSAGVRAVSFGLSTDIPAPTAYLPQGKKSGKH